MSGYEAFAIHDGPSFEVTDPMLSFEKEVQCSLFPFNSVTEHCQHRIMKGKSVDREIGKLHIAG